MRPILCLFAAFQGALSPLKQLLNGWSSARGGALEHLVPPRMFLLSPLFEPLAALGTAPIRCVTQPPHDCHGHHRRNPYDAVRRMGLRSAP